MMSNDSTINVQTKTNRVNKITKLDLLQLEFTLQYILLTCYYIVNDTFRRWVMTAPLMCKKNNRVNKITKLDSIHLEFTLQYITLTDYYIVKDTFR